MLEINVTRTAESEEKRLQFLMNCNQKCLKDARCVMVAESGIAGPSSNPEFAFYKALKLLRNVRIQQVSLQLWINNRVHWSLYPRYANRSKRGKTLNSNLKRNRPVRLFELKTCYMSISPTTKLSYGTSEQKVNVKMNNAFILLFHNFAY